MYLVCGEALFDFFSEDGSGNVVLNLGEDLDRAWSSVGRRAVAMRSIYALQEGLRARAVLETNAVSDLVSERDVHLVRDTLGDAHRGDPTRLRARDLELWSTEVGEIRVGDVLRDPVGT